MRKKQFFAGAAIVAAFVVLSGCTSYPKPPSSVTKSNYTSLSADEKQLLPDGVSALSLDEAQNTAVQNNPDFKAKYFAIVGARAKYYQSFSAYLPTIKATYSIGQDYNDYYGDPASAATPQGNDMKTTYSTPGMNASLVVFDSFVREMNVLAAKHSWKYNEALELDARRILLRSVAYAYNNVLLAKAKINIAEEDMKYNNALLRENELKFEAGSIPLSDVLNFKVRYNNAEGNLYSAQYTYAYSKYILAELMGLTDSNIPDEVKFPEMPSPDGEVLADIAVYLDMSLANRPDLKAYRESLEVAKYNYWSSICSFGPVFTANASTSYDYRKKTYSHTAGSKTNTASFGYSGVATWELFSGGKTYFTMRAAQALVSQTDFQLAAKWINVISDVRSSYDNYINNYKQVKLYQKTLELVRKTRDLVDEEYRAGNTNLTRLNEAQRDLVNAETNLVTAVVNMHNAKAQLTAATSPF